MSLNSQFGFFYENISRSHSLLRYQDENYSEQRQVLRSRNLDLSLLILFVVCGASCAYFLFIGKPQIAGTVFWVEVLAFMLLLMVQNKINEVVVLLIGISPLINYLRVFAFYNIVVLLFGTSFFFLLFRDSKLGKKHVVENPGLTFLFVYQLIYYILTYINTGDYWANLRGFELLFVAGLILILASSNLNLLKTALWGVLISVFAIGIGFSPHENYQNRLGMAILDGHSLGNPITLGLPVALVFLGLLMDQGFWFGLKSSRLRRLVLILITAILLALTTSRGSWLVVVGGLLSTLILNSRQRIKLLTYLGVIALVASFFLQTEQGKTVQYWYDRTVNSADLDLDISQRSSGRSDQWIVGWYALSNSPLHMLLGYGAGNGPKVYAMYSPLVTGIRYAIGNSQALHSLFSADFS